MGLRLHTNVSSVIAQHNLGRADFLNAKSTERLATGTRIVTSSDDPSGFVVSEQLRAQIQSLGQAVQNTEIASNLVNTAEAALAEVSSLLIKIRESAIFSLNSGGISTEQITAEQDTVDAAIGSINRIGATTRFASNSLLNGTSGFNVTGQANAIENLSIRSMTFGNSTSKQVDIDVTSAAERATLTVQVDPSGAGAVGPQVIEITGALGTEQFLIASGTTTQDLIGIVNSARDTTGIYATLASGSLGAASSTDTLELLSDNFGSDQSASLKVISGSDIFGIANSGGTPTAIIPGGEINDTGSDVGLFVTGYQASVVGNSISITSSTLTVDFTLADGTGATGSNPLSILVERSGLKFQLNTEAQATDAVYLGFDSVSAFELGTAERTLGGTGSGTGLAAQTVGGYLSSVLSGGANDLATNPGNALAIIDAAIADVTGFRESLGAFEAQQLQSNVSSLNLAFEHITQTRSSIRDLDFADESVTFTRSQILVSAGVSVLASANLVSNPVLSLLQ